MSIKFTRYTAESHLNDAETQLRDGMNNPDIQYRIDVARSDIQSLDNVDAPDSDYEAVCHEASSILGAL